MKTPALKVLGELTLLAAPDAAPRAVEFIASHATGQGYGAKRIDEIGRALAEALRNIVEYAYGKEGGEIHISCNTDNAGRLVVIIVDFAEAFNVLLASDPVLGEEYRSHKGAQPSVAAMKRYIRNVEYKRLPGKNALTFTVARDLQQP